MTVEISRACLATEEVCARRLAWGAKRIAAYLGKTEKWFRRQRERGKRPPPHFTIGAAVVADCDELDRWIETAKARKC